MQSVSGAFTAETKDKTRKIAASLQISWKKDFRSSITFFTIGVSTIGGNDIIAGSAGIQSAWNRYLYEDESERLLNLAYERELNMPLGGIAKSLADVRLDNTSGRYLPDYMGGTSSIFTAIGPMKPAIINTGFEIAGIDQLIPQFVGVLDRQPRTDIRSKTTELQMTDFLEFLTNRYIDHTTMYTGQRSDQLIETLLSGLGYATAQYELDTGIDIIPFAIFESGAKLIDVINQITQAEMGHFYQDEEGRLRFENRQHWDSSPHNTVQQIIYTADVIDAEMPDDDHIINTVEIVSQPRLKQPNQLVFTLSSSIEIASGAEYELFVNFDDPMLSIDTPVYRANTLEDGTGTDVGSSVLLRASDEFAQAAKYIYHNYHTGTAYITDLTIYGRPAKVATDIFYKAQDDSSVTAYEERLVRIENNYIHSQDWAQSMAQMILSQFSNPESLQEITIKAMPHLQLGDLISWQGRYWTIYGIQTGVDPNSGFVQRLRLLQRTIETYFRIGISTIGGDDKIAP